MKDMLLLGTAIIFAGIIFAGVVIAGELHSIAQAVNKKKDQN
jgi:hypothetical protein